MWPRGQIIRARPHTFWPRPHRNWPRIFTVHMTLINIRNIAGGDLQAYLTEVTELCQWRN